MENGEETDLYGLGVVSESGQEVIGYERLIFKNMKELGLIVR